MTYIKKKQDNQYRHLVRMKPDRTERSIERKRQRKRFWKKWFDQKKRIGIDKGKTLTNIKAQPKTEKNGRNRSRKKKTDP